MRKPFLKIMNYFNHRLEATEHGLTGRQRPWGIVKIVNIKNKFIGWVYKDKKKHPTIQLLILTVGCSFDNILNFSCSAEQYKPMPQSKELSQTMPY